MLTAEFNIDIAKRVWQEETREEGREEGIEEGREEGIDIGLVQKGINAAVNLIKILRISLTDALALVELDISYREQMVLILQDQGIEYVE